MTGCLVAMLLLFLEAAHHNPIEITIELFDYPCGGNSIQFGDRCAPSGW